MIKSFEMNKEHQIVETDDYSKKNLWINVSNPSKEEINYLIEKFGLSDILINYALDLEEISKIDFDNKQCLILVRSCFSSIALSENHGFITYPIGIIIQDDKIFTISKVNADVLEEIAKGNYLEIDINKKSRFIIQIIYNIIQKYQKSLRKIDNRTYEIEEKLYGDTDNKHIIELLSLKKTLDYFSTSLIGNEKVLQRLFRKDYLEKFEEDKMLLEDTIIETQQAREMASISGNILDSIRDAFSSIINNNVNSVMKMLASITIVLNIPMLITSFLGMNIGFPKEVMNPFFIYYLCASVLIITYIIYKFMKKKGMF